MAGSLKEEGRGNENEATAKKAEPAERRTRKK
jgi:hypothetical protein